MKRVGITGIIGSGKSTFCRLLSAYSGAPIYDSDLRAKELMLESKRVLVGVMAIFGERAYRRGHLNTEYIAQQIFSDEHQRRALESVVHPAVLEDFEHWCTKQNAPYVIVESALLFDTALAEHVDIKIVIDAPVELCISRAAHRDGSSREQIEARMKNQMTAEQMRASADRVIMNDDYSLMLPSVQQTDTFIKAMPECPR